MPRVTRRRFLRSALAAAAAPYVLAPGALGAGRPAPSRRIAMGCIGMGGKGFNNMQIFMGFPEVQVVAVCDVDADKRDRAQAATEGRYGAGACAAYGDFRDLLARPDLDAVSIATPDHWHAVMAIEAARRGRDIYCEKPLSLTVAEARAMVRAAREHGVVFQTGSQQRSSAPIRRACELVRSGRIGRVLTVHVDVGEPSRDCPLPGLPVPAGLDWDMWLGPAPWAPYHPERCAATYGGGTGWRAWRDYSGGMMTDWGAHHFDIAQWGLGMDGSGPVEILPRGWEGARTLTYRYANGVVMHRAAGGLGSITFTGTGGRVGTGRDYCRTDPPSIGRDGVRPEEIRLYESRHHHADFLDCVRTRGRPVADVEIGCRSVTVCHLGNIATWLGRALKWDPVREQFAGDAEANRWLDRPKREPWRI